MASVKVLTLRIKQATDKQVSQKKALAATVAKISDLKKALATAKLSLIHI